MNFRNELNETVGLTWTVHKFYYILLQLKHQMNFRNELNDSVVLTSTLHKFYYN